jgi:hypothetical protein
MNVGSLIAIALLGNNCLGTPDLTGQGPEGTRSAADPLAPFEALIGGQWHLDDSYQVFEWGVGRRSVKSRSYLVLEGSPKLVAEGFWYWHPKERQIRGAFTAIEMPAVYFEYTTRFEDGVMVNDLRSYDADGVETAYVETWELTDSDHYRWTLFTETPDGLQEVMAGTFDRRNEDSRELLN